MNNMGKVIIQNHTTKNPISLIGEEAGVCWGADTSNQEKNYKRGLDCLKANHGRTWEFPSVYMVLDGYSARVIREFYTHIGGAPTRLQASTRYIDYQKGFEYVIPPSVSLNSEAYKIYCDAMKDIAKASEKLLELGVPREDAANLLPLGMETKVVCKFNPRTLIDMSHQRECTRAYWEFRGLMADIKEALCAYSDEWKEIVEMKFMPKCELFGECTETYGCGRY